MKQKLPEGFLQLCRSIKSKRPRTVIEHIIEHGYITTEELKNLYGYNHPPRAARDVREHGIPLETFRITDSTGRSIAAYKFADPTKTRADKLSGRTTFSKAFKKKLIERYGSKCAIHLEDFDERYLQIDHRIPYQISGDVPAKERNPDDYMLLCSSANRAKSWSCEHCVNWQELKSEEICQGCFWAYPENYSHIAMQPIRRLDIVWLNEEVDDYEKLKKESIRLKKELPDYVKTILRKHLSNDE